MLEAVVQTVVDALAAAGISAAAAYGAGPITRTGGFVRVGVKQASGSGAGLARYLGAREDAELGTQEVYGMLCEMELRLDVFIQPPETENAALSALSLFDRAAAVVGGIGGLDVREIYCGEALPDAETGLVRLSGGVKCAGLLTLERTEDAETAFADFILRGELKG